MEPTLSQRIGAFALDALGWIVQRLWVFVLLIGILMAGYILAKPVHAQAVCDNRTVEALVADLKAEVSDAEIVLYVGSEAQNVIRQYNAMPPVSAFAGDAVTVVIHPTGPVAAVIIERKGCVVDASLVPVNLLRLPAPSRGNGV